MISDGSKYIHSKMSYCTADVVAYKSRKCYVYWNYVMYIEIHKFHIKCDT